PSPYFQRIPRQVETSEDAPALQSRCQLPADLLTQSARADSQIGWSVWRVRSGDCERHRRAYSQKAWPSAGLVLRNEVLSEPRKTLRPRPMRVRWGSLA